ncbi:early nodulin-75-like [Helianthus annuus]|uniref:early nodulin-75-like n=1 Tax=Helianthus annuus TaxID=4232 RepID=UPI000B9090E1|nr:early nodulin-75-like [Helianthus annuus]
MPLDVVSDDDIYLFEEDLPEADYEGGAPIVADVILPIAEAPVEELPVGSPAPDSFESVASASLHDQGVQHHSPDADPDMALSAAPAPAHEFEFDHEVDDDLDPVFPHDFDPDQEIEFIHLDQPLEAPVAPIDPLFDIPADFDMDLVDPEPIMASEPVLAPDPALEHDPVHDDAPAIAPLVDDIPIAYLPVVAPPLVDDPVVDAPLPDPVSVLFDRAPFAAHIDPRYADTRNGWIDDDGDYPPYVLAVTPPVAPVSAPTDIPLFPPHTTDAHRTDLPITFLQDIPLPRPGEGSSRQPPVSALPMMPPRCDPRMPTNEAELQEIIAAAIAQYAASHAETSGNILHNHDTGVSDTLDPMAVVSDDEIPSDREVYTSDTTSTDDDDFQPFALPDIGAEPADGLPAGD